ncbi:MAG: hypothetical protein O9264_13940 [Leptospira sp.]|nr:hypothetical protein [Leptospira sp.]
MSAESKHTPESVARAYMESVDLKPYWAKELEKIDSQMEVFQEKISSQICELNFYQTEFEKLKSKRVTILQNIKQPGLFA